MDFITATQPWRDRAWAGYLVAIAAPFIALAVRFGTGDALIGFPFLTFFPAVLIASFLGSWHSGVVATLLSESLAAYFLIDPPYSSSVGGPPEWLALALFNVGSALIIGLMHVTNGALARLAAAGHELLRINEALERRVTERTGELVGANATLRTEIATREAMEAQIRQSQRMEVVGQLTGGIAHDFNNMLQTVTASLELMQLRIVHGRPEEVGRYVDAVAQAVDRAAGLTHRLLAFARRQMLAPEPVEPDALVGDMVELIRSTVGPQIEVRTRLNDGVWTVLCDPGQLQNALLNLALNARDAMPGGGMLTVATVDVSLSSAEVSGHDRTEPGEYVEISVTDTGTGMNPDVVARAFEPFFTTKPIGQGTGLGLSQLYGFVRQSNGEVRLDSTLGLGTTVRLYLPRYAEADGAARSEHGGVVPAVLAEAGVTSGPVSATEDGMTACVLAAGMLRELGLPPSVPLPTTR